MWTAGIKFDCPDIVTRVFQMKLKEFIRDITVCHVLGVVIAHIHVIEFQKRSLPHYHMLIHLHPEDKLRNAEDIDHLINAEIPDPHDPPDLYEVGHLNPHSVCMKDGKCTKKYPKEYSVNEYPLYHRRDNGRTVRVQCVDVDNRWVVPCNPWLSRKYAAHINVEPCMSVKSVKYLYKYTRGMTVQELNVMKSIIMMK